MKTPVIGEKYHLSLPKAIDCDGYLEDLDTQEMCPTDISRDQWDTAITGKPVKVYDLLVGFPNGRAYALVNFDEEDPDEFDIMVPWAYLSVYKTTKEKLCNCTMDLLIARGCQCGGM